MARGIDHNELAVRTGLTQEQISQIIKGSMPITPEVAAALEEILDIKASLWLNLEAQYQQFQQTTGE